MTRTASNCAPRAPRPSLEWTPNVESTSALDVAKWLIPGVTGLFAVIGYLVRSAHAGLIGRDVDFASATGYAGAAADFVSDLPPVVIDALLDLQREFSVAGHFLELVRAGLGVVLVLLIARWARDKNASSHDKRLAAVAHYLPVAALLFLLAWKFLTLDAPLGKVEGVVIGTNLDTLAEKEPTPWSAESIRGAAQARVAAAAASAAGTLSATAAGASASASASASTPARDLPQQHLQRFIAAEADCLYRSIALTRLRQAGSDLHTLPGQDVHGCPADNAVGTDVQKGEFVARLMGCALVAVLAVVAVRQRTFWINAIGVLGLASLLTLPYAYGKLMVPSYFEVGQVLLSESLAKVALRGPVDASARMIEAIVLSRRGPEIDLLVRIPVSCPGLRGGGAADTALDSYQFYVGRLWTIPASQILSIREIHREDVIAWKLHNDRGCPQKPTVRQPISES
ncbi:hypothetical protein [Ramlibacter sp. AN1133]|uniref:hypothetical protein n=1 Tax=Ramlibacter sp. AN1133 TaxID=3133429 RepID=UPI0030BE981A